MKLEQIQLSVAGRVQGVGFRQSALREAQKLGLFGWVRNTETGTVEILAEGEPEATQALLKWCYGGPPQSKVTKVTVIQVVKIERLNFREFTIE